MSELHQLDRAAALTRIEPGLYRGATSDDYWNMGGPFGGATIAALLNAVLIDERRVADPAAITLNFTAMIAKGEFDIAVREVRTGKSFQHFYVELTQAGVVAANATIVCARRETGGWRHQRVQAPSLPPAEAVAPMASPGFSRFIEQFEFRFVEGEPRPRKTFDGVAQPSHTLMWINNKPPRPWDFLGLATICDIFFGRSLLATGVFAPFATVSFTAHFHCDAPSLAACGDRPLIADADAHVFYDGISDQLATIWAPSGQLLATTTQIVTFKTPPISV